MKKKVIIGLCIVSCLCLFGFRTKEIRVVKKDCICPVKIQSEITIEYKGNDIKTIKEVLTYKNVDEEFWKRMQSEEEMKKSDKYRDENSFNKSGINWDYSYIQHGDERRDIQRILILDVPRIDENNIKNLEKDFPYYDLSDFNNTRNNLILDGYESR